jgi:uncharacterized protein (TIGR02284 family)
MSDVAISALNHLIETCRDGEMGFWSAAEHVRDEGLKWMFKGIARKRGQFAEELKEEIRRLGGAVEEGGSVAGSAHRGWMDVKGAVKGHSDTSIIAEAERGEHRAVRAYEEALNTSLPPSTASIVRNQYSDVKDTYDRVKALVLEWEQRGRSQRP